MFTKLIIHLFLNNINIINKCIHTFDISIVINISNNNMILKFILYLPKTLTYN